MYFLTRTFHNVFYVRIGKRDIRSACEQSFQEPGGETEVGRRSLPPASGPSPLLPAPQTCFQHTNRTPTRSSDLRRSYFAWNWTTAVVMLATTAMLSSNSCKSACFLCILKEVDLYSAFIEVPYTQGAQVRITQWYLQITPYLPLPRKHSPDGASQTEVADI